MKTKTILLLCLLMGAGLTQLSAQKGKNGTGTISYYYVWQDDPNTEGWEGFSMDVYCGNKFVDHLEGSVTFHELIHFKDGAWVRIINQDKGEATSTLTGEVFRVKENGWTDKGVTTAILKANYIGNQGSHYIMTVSLDFATGEVEFIKTVCPGDDK